MEGFTWAEDNLRVSTPHELQDKGVNVFFAPNIRAGLRLVNLENGRVDVLQPEEPPWPEGYWADLEGLERYCRAEGIPLDERDGKMVPWPATPRTAGDPLTSEG